MKEFTVTSFSLRPGLTVGLALLLAVPALAQSVIFNELHYHPQSERLEEEFIELHNLSGGAVNLAGWQLSRGVSYTFPAVTLEAGGFLVVAADTNVFRAVHSGFAGALLGNWTGSLSDRGETVELTDAAGVIRERFRYATQGDWGDRGVSASHQGFRGVEWQSGHDGRGRTLERVNPAADAGYGQNWRASAAAGGSPGAANSAFREATPPFVLQVAHAPIVPRSSGDITFTAKVVDSVQSPTVVLRHRVDGAGEFTSSPMNDAELNGDAAGGDQTFTVRLPAMPDGTVVEYYVLASGPAGTRTWPAPLSDGRQDANALLQVDDSEEGSLPRFRLVVTEHDRQTLAAIEAQPWYLTSDALVNATLVVTDRGVVDLRHQVGLRIRGNTSRDVLPPSRRVNLPDDRPYRDQRVLTFGGVNPHSQVAAAALAQLSGLPAGRSRLVEVRENGVVRSGMGSPVPGLYAQNETLNGDYVRNAFPGDEQGNLYRVVGYGNLDYLGEASDAYRHPDFYYKETNAGEDDWSDLAGLTGAINGPPTAGYAGGVTAVADTDEWVRYFAANTLLANFESTLSNPRVTVTPTNTTVVTGDYYLYRGVEDPRFRLVPYDLDSCLGADGAFTAGIGLYSFLGVPALNRLFQEPLIAAKYQAEVRRLADTVFRPENVDALLDRLLGGHVPSGLLAAMKDFNVRRRGFVLSNLPAEPRVLTSFPAVGGYSATTDASVSLSGVAPGDGVVSARVSGTPAAWDATQGKWAATVPVSPGLNRLLIEFLDAAGQVIRSLPYDLWREVAETVVDGVLAADTTWRAEDGPFRVNQRLTVPPGVTLTVTPGTSIQFAPGASVLVQGRLLAEGTPQRRIEWLRHPRLGGLWNGLGFDGATNESRIAFADFRSTQRAVIQTTNSTLRLEGLAWPGHQANVLLSYNSSLTVRGCEFPTMVFDEAVQGDGMPAGGHVVFEGNTFGSTIGYADIVDFSGGQRPGPIPQFLNNVFNGGSDDGLDLDGTDAHIEGNVFRHFHKNHGETSVSSGVATGRGKHGEISHLTVVRNVFYDNDHDLVAKDFAEVTAAQNTFVGTRIGSLALSEPLRPGGDPPVSVRLRDNIWWNCAQVFFGLDTNLFANSWFDVRVDNSILSETGPWTGTNVFSADPLFRDPTNDFRLRAASPARGKALGGLDLGAWVPVGAVVLGLPATPTAAPALTLQIVGAGLTHYRYSIDAGEWSPPRTLATTLETGELGIGKHELRVQGLTSAGVWQAEPGTVATWERVGSFGGVRLNELLAENGGAVPVSGASPDLLELFNPGDQPADLGGMSVTDNPKVPRKYVIPAGTVIPAGGYLVLFADSRSEPAGLHLGYSFDNDGEQALLFSAEGTLVDEVAFGAQLAGRSIGRDTAGNWTLCEPTFGAPNHPSPLGDARLVRINEWLAQPPTGGDDAIELFNPEPLPIRLDGIYVTDALAGAPRRAPLFPLTFIGARGFLALTADGSADKAGKLNLALAPDFGSIALTDWEGLVLDALVYGPQAPGFSEGRQPDGSGPVVQLMGGPSLGLSNGVPPQEPLRLATALTADGLSLTINLRGAVPGQRYRLDRRPDLVSPWVAGMETVATTGVLSFGSVPLGASFAFFRAVPVE